MASDAAERKRVNLVGQRTDRVKTEEMAESFKGEPTNARAPDPPICPRCLGLIPTNDKPGEYPGAWSRRNRDQEYGLSINDSTQVCSACGDEESMIEASPAMQAVFTGNTSLQDEVWPVSTGRAPLRRHEAEAKGVSHRTGKAMMPVGPSDEPSVKFFRYDKNGKIDEGAIVRRWGRPPHPRDVAEWRNQLMHAWHEGGTLHNMAHALDAVGQHFEPHWEFRTLKDASLWFVGKDMCDLLEVAAPKLPDTALTDDICPFPEGLVVFERPIFGIDAEGSDYEVAVGGYVWGRSLWGADYSRMLGITCYGPNPHGAEIPLLPLGTLIWPYGVGPDDGLDWMVDREGHGASLTPQQQASMAEDRRRLMALWLLSSQPGLTANRSYIDRATERREFRAAHKARRPMQDNRVRIITLRRPASPQGEPQEGETHKEWQHRWMVSGHWRDQPYGPDRSLRRMQFIHPYIKGPDDKPFLGGATVRSWTR
jgi:hypothetical protein